MNFTTTQHTRIITELKIHSTLDIKKTGNVRTNVQKIVAVEKK
jgi:hypothetical protein